MKIFSCDQIRKIDDFTITNEPVASIDLMERAAAQLLKWITQKIERSVRIIIFTGPGNNGGDGLALARMLDAERYNVGVYYIKVTDKVSEDWEKNREKLESGTSLKLIYLTSSDQFPLISEGDIIIDAIFGSGLSRPAEGFTSEIIKQINDTGADIVSIDIPSGLFGEDNTENIYEGVIKAHFTLSFQFPKLSFMFPENGLYVGEWIVLPIGLSEKAIRSTHSPYSLLERDKILPVLKKRDKFAHKGNFGHGLLVSGSSGKMGAAVLGAEASLRTGIGLITCHIPACGNLVLQSTLPEAMVRLDKSDTYISDVGNTSDFSAIGIGPGIGTGTETQMVLANLLAECDKPMVIDADAINILSLKREYINLIPADSILTPHPREFERLAGKTENGYTRLMKQIEFSQEHNCIVVLKGAHTSITRPDGNVLFNNTGNPGMATAGAGDVLTGIILSLLAQGYQPDHAAVLGVYLHGLAGDIAAEVSCYESVIASDIINCIGEAFTRIRNNET